MVIIADLLIMIGLPIVLFVMHRLWPQLIARQKNGILAILAAWFSYTFFGSRIGAGESITMVAYSALIVAVMVVIMVLVLKYLPDQARKYNSYFRFGFMAAAAVAMVTGWMAGGF